VRRIKQSFKVTPALEAAAEGEPPHAHRRAFSKSIAFEVMRLDTAVEIGSSDIRANLLQHGGIVRPVKAKALAVPALEEDASLYGKRPRDVPGLTYVPMPQTGTGLVGVLIRGRMKGRGKKRHEAFAPAFWLYGRVRIRPHPWLAITEGDWDYFGDALQKRADRAVGGAT
jgi:hypothetical protein